LFQQTPEGNFVDIAAQIGLDLPAEGTFLWLDADLDGDMDLFWSATEGFSLYRNESGTFLPDRIDTAFPHGRGYKLCMADYDNDGDFDIFSAASRGNVLLVNTNGRLTAVNPSTVGLPQASKTANWVDYDNDGLMDLHLVPGGLYRQTQTATFLPTSMLQFTPDKLSIKHFESSRAAWFDADSNGTRDLLLANQYVMKKTKWATLYAKLTASEEQFGKLGYFWKSRFFLNKNMHNHWLQVQLVGPPTNRQAIGARVTVVTPEGEHTQQVGGAEGSHYSQGHYRLYFGLGANRKVLRVNVNWPNGQAIEMSDVTTDQLLHIHWEKIIGDHSKRNN
jgi:hypothetical protein